MAQDQIDAATKINITPLTAQSARKNKEPKEKSLVTIASKELLCKNNSNNCTESAPFFFLTSIYI